jgi:hypothetical protein
MNIKAYRLKFQLNTECIGHIIVLAYTTQNGQNRVQMFSSAPCSQTPPVYVLPIMSETKFHTHTKLKAKL